MTFLLALLAVARAGEVRVGVFVGDNHGPDSLPALAFAESDATKMHDLFVDLGQMQSAELVVGQTRPHVQEAMLHAKALIDAANARGDRTEFIFYYSGHGDEHGLMLSDTTIGNDELRRWLDQTDADVRIAFLDSCRSGAAIRAKGGTRGPSYDFAVDVEQAKGTAILTSSAANQFSTESDEIGGGFFTHYLHTALSGAADADANGDVTLTEAYDYVHTKTAFATHDAPGVQTPGFDYDLTGSGDVTLTRIGDASSYLYFPGGLDGQYAVWDETRKRYEAEVDGARPAKLALRPGQYYVHHRMPGWVDEAMYVLQKGDARTIGTLDFKPVAYEDTASRGPIAKEARQANIPPFTILIMAGARGFGGNSVYATQYVPTHPVAGFELRRRYPIGLYGSVDFLTGTAESTLSFGDAGTRQVDVTSRSLGGAIGWSPGTKLVVAGIAFHAELISFARSFPNGEVAGRQVTTTIAPGGSLWVGLHYQHASVDLDWNPQLLPVQWDGHPWPLYGDVLLRLGWRL